MMPCIDRVCSSPALSPARWTPIYRVPLRPKATRNRQPPTKRVPGIVEGSLSSAVYRPRVTVPSKYCPLPLHASQRRADLRTGIMRPNVPTTAIGAMMSRSRRLKIGSHYPFFRRDYLSCDLRLLRFFFPPPPPMTRAKALNRFRRRHISRLLEPRCKGNS